MRRIWSAGLLAGLSLAGCNEQPPPANQVPEMSSMQRSYATQQYRRSHRTRGRAHTKHARRRKTTICPCRSSLICSGRRAG